MKIPRTLVLALAVLAGSTATAAGWEAPVRLAGPAEVLNGPRLATDAAGNALLVWSPGAPVPGQTSELPGESWVEAAFRPAGASGWGPAERVSPAGQPAYFPVAGLLPGGRALVAWSALQATSVFHESVREAGGSWAPDRAVGDAVPYAGDWAVGPDGTAAAAWTKGAPPNSTAMVAVRTPDGTWGAPASLGTVALATSLPLVIGPDGTVTAVLTRTKGRGLQLVSRVRGTDGTWGPDLHLADVDAPNGTTLSVRAVLSEAGDLVVTWADIRLRRGARWTIHAVSVVDGRARAVTLGRRGVPPVHLTSGPTGVRVIWQGEDRRARVARWTRLGGWRAAVAAPASLICPGGSVAASATGALGEDVLVVTQNGMLRAVVHRPDGTWSVPRVIAAPGVGLGLPVVAGTSAGRIDVAWARSIGGTRSVVETTSTTLEDVDTAAVPQDLDPVVSGIRLIRRAGRPPALAFTLSRAATVSIQVPVRPVPDVRAHHGRNVVPLRLVGNKPLPRGRVQIVISPRSGAVAGCQVTQVVDLP